MEVLVLKSYCCIAGLKVTSLRPCWVKNRKEFLSTGNLTLSCRFYKKNVLYWPPKWLPCQWLQSFLFHLHVYYLSMTLPLLKQQSRQKMQFYCLYSLTCSRCLCFLIPLHLIIQVNVLSIYCYMSFLFLYSHDTPNNIKYMHM